MCYVYFKMPYLGSRISISQKAGLGYSRNEKDGSYGAFSGSCKLNKDFLSNEVINELGKGRSCFIASSKG